MRRTIGIVVISVALGTAAFVVATIGGRFSDGPLRVIPGIPGGPLSGEGVRGSDPDWSFVRDVDTIELQIGSSPARSIFTGVVVYEGALYVPVTLTPLKLWHKVVSSSPRVVARIDGRLFEREAVSVSEPEMLEQLISAGQSKYGPPFHATWTGRFTRYFRLDPLPAPRGQ